MLLPHHHLLYGQHFKWGPCALLTLAVMGSRHVISPPPHCHITLPPAESLASPFKLLLQFLEGSKPGGGLKK